MVATLRAQTGDQHRALHVHPVFRPLAGPAPTGAEVRDVLLAFARLFEVIEAARARHATPARFTLGPELEALWSDLGTRPAPLPEGQARFRNAAEVLGGLYVAHGAAFGRLDMARTCARALPGMHSRFLSRRPDQTLWRALQHELELQADSDAARQSILRGACDAFDLAARWAAPECTKAWQATCAPPQ